MSKNSFTVIDVKTGNYPDIEAIALHEDWAKGLMYCDMEGFAIQEDGSLVLMDECNNSRCCPIGRFEIVWNDDEALLKQEAVVAHWADDTGHWIEGDRNGIDPHTRTTGEMIDTFRCTWCGFYQYWKTPFCPNCGAKMEGR